MLRKTDKNILDIINDRLGAITLLSSALISIGFFLLVMVSVLFSLAFSTMIPFPMFSYLTLNDHINYILQNEFILWLIASFVFGCISRLMENKEVDNKSTLRILLNCTNNLYMYLLILIFGISFYVVVIKLKLSIPYLIIYQLIFNLTYFILPLVVLRKENKKGAARNANILTAVLAIFVFIPLVMGANFPGFIQEEHQITHKYDITLIVTKSKKYEKMLLIRDFDRGKLVLDSESKPHLINKSDIEYEEYAPH